MRCTVSCTDESDFMTRCTAICGACFCEDAEKGCIVGACQHVEGLIMGRADEPWAMPARNTEYNDRSQRRACVRSDAFIATCKL